MSNQPILVSVNEARRLIGLGRTRLYALINAKQIETVKIGRRTLVKYASLEALAAKQPRAA